MNAAPSPAAAPVSLTAASVESAIRVALGIIRPGADNIRGDADLAQEADLDSAEVMDLVMEIEDRLDLSISVETMAQAHTIDELCAGIVHMKQATL